MIKLYSTQTATPFATGWIFAIYKDVGAPIARLLRGKGPDLREVADSTKQELKLSICRTWCILRNLMARNVHRHPCQTSLCMCYAHYTTARNEANRDRRNRLCGSLVEHEAKCRIVRDIKKIAWGLRESLFAVPGHVVQRRKGAVRQQEEIEQAATDEDVVGTFDNRW